MGKYGAKNDMGVKPLSRSAYSSVAPRGKTKLRKHIMKWAGEYGAKNDMGIKPLSGSAYSSMENK